MSLGGKVILRIIAYCNDFSISLGIAIMQKKTTRHTRRPITISGDIADAAGAPRISKYVVS